MPRGDAATVNESILPNFPKSDTLSAGETTASALGVPRGDAATVSDSGQVFSLGVTLSSGWSTFSIPIIASNSLFFATTGLGTSSQNGLVDPSKVIIAFKFNAAAQTWSQLLAGATILPLDGVVVRSTAPHTATLILSTVQTSPPTKSLSAPWNLTGPAALLGTQNKQVDLALISALNTPAGLVGYTQVVSPSLNTPSFSWTRGEVSPPSFTRWRGYWVFMENADILTGETTTPLSS